MYEHIKNISPMERDFWYTDSTHKMLFTLVSLMCVSGFGLCRRNHSLTTNLSHTRSLINKALYLDISQVFCEETYYRHAYIIKKKKFRLERSINDVCVRYSGLWSIPVLRIAVVRSVNRPSELEGGGGVGGWRAEGTSVTLMDFEKCRILGRHQSRGWHFDCVIKMFYISVRNPCLFFSSSTL